MTSQWVTTPFWAAFRRVKRTGFPDKDLLSVYREHGVVRKRDRDDNFNVESSDLGSYQLVNRGDLAINKMKAWQGSLGISAHEGIVSPAYFVFKVTSGDHAGYLNYLLRSREFAGLFRSLSKGIRPNQWDLDPDQLRTIKLHLPPLAEQRAIADFLDRETAQIDALVAKQEDFIQLLRERRGAAQDRLLLSMDAPRVPLRHVTDQVTVGIVVQPARWYASDGVIALRGTNVKPERIDLSDLVHLSIEGHARHPKSQLRTGDVVVVRTGQSGVAAVVPEALSGSNAIDLLLIRPRQSVLSGEYLAMAMNAPSVLEASRLEMVGTIQGHLNVGALRGLVLPVPSVTEQADAVREWRLVSSKIDTLITKAEEHITLAKERREALITAAVTGQIDVRTSREAS